MMQQKGAYTINKLTPSDVCSVSTPAPSTSIEGGPVLFVDEGSMVNLSCVVKHTERPPKAVKWIHRGKEISFRGPRNGVSVRAHLH